MKKDTSTKDLCKGLPSEFGKFLDYCRNLQFKDVPDYAYYRKIFRNLLKRKQIEYDYMFDWLIRKSDLKQIKMKGDVINEDCKQKLKSILEESIDKNDKEGRDD